MISHVPGPFERFVRRLCARVEDWMDSQAVRKLVAEGHVAPPAPLPVRAIEVEPEPAPVPQVAHPSKSKALRRPNKPAKRPAQSDRKVVTSIVKAIAEGRATGSQREIARAYNVGRTTVQRAQRMAEELVH